MSLQQEKVAGFNAGGWGISGTQVGNGEKEASVEAAAVSAFVQRYHFTKKQQGGVGGGEGEANCCT